MKEEKTTEQIEDTKVESKERETIKLPEKSEEIIRAIENPEAFVRSILLPSVQKIKGLKVNSYKELVDLEKERQLG